MIRYEVTGEKLVPDQGIVFLHMDGEEREAMPFSRGEFHLLLAHPGLYHLQLSVDSHDRLQRFLLLPFSVNVSEHGWQTSSTPDEPCAEPSVSSSSEDGERVLPHSLRRLSSSPCPVHCLDTEALQERRDAAAMELDEHAAAAARKPFVVQVGACDGRSFDPLHKYIIDRGWHGVLVEPLPDLFQSLKETYKHSEGLKFANVAVTDPDQAISGIGAAQEDFELYSQRVIKQKVTCVTLSEQLFSSHQVERIDWFQVDAEGYDASILKQLDLPRWRPAVISMETINLQAQELAQVYSSLTTSGYDVCSDGRDLLALLTSP
ncbi:hypothetical protein GUITHDRAFT_121851 [Guillardia theta CCMP2712]|uniref:Methyltransferase FkbM domain-containing protein n=1 Tax=Guillardia theta (strain CCMP2712) TaxID=905079 RepID=L1I6T9_GUITC|nr:hypothetical protein GUITHDRAFT_121851 [Guillardia theta CCMP2712]EKX31978.1 hypothetical protein GUITHDRAFT_121851 [Guillardia theta CCMP2712]|eukprot:XP_005818958.1 hypothetical protein GUITHDRAFT_121851 [Guillardia theta CCMP2712]